VTVSEKLRPGLVIAVNHEPLGFLRRAGYASVDQETAFLDDHREEMVERLARAGCDMVRTHFYKGFGLAAEHDEMEMTRDYVRLCHRHGLMVQLYVQVGTLQYETLLAERPDMRDWAQVDDRGEPITLVYGHQPFRWYPCFNRPGYWDYLEGIVRLAVGEFGADAIGFDNITTAEEPSVCHCDRCRDAFRAFLARKYRPDTPEGSEVVRERFGYDILEHVRPPVWNYFVHPFNLAQIRDPVTQEWVLFRCESLHAALQRLYRTAKAVNPDVLLECNTYKQSGANTALIHGVYVPDYADCFDAFWNECDPAPEYTGDRRLLHKVRGYKMARAMGKAVFSTQPTGSTDRAKVLAYAESMAFNRGIVGGVARAAAIARGEETVFAPLRTFARLHADLFDAQSCATVALLEAKPSLAFGTYRAHHANLTVHQALLRAHVPYDLVFDCSGLGRYRTVVLSGAELLADDDIDGIVAFVEAGGGLVMVEGSGSRDAWGRARGPRALARRLAGSGDGTVFVLDGLESAKPLDLEGLAFRPFDVNQPVLDTTYWQPLRNPRQFARAIRRATGGSLPVEVDAPEHVVIDIQRTAGGPVVLHVLNYRCEAPARGIRVRFSAGVRAGARELRCLEPETGAERRFPLRGDRAVRLPAVRTWLLAVVSEPVRS